MFQPVFFHEQTVCCLWCCLLSFFYTWLPSWELTYPLPKVLLKMIFLFPFGGIFESSSLEAFWLDHPSPTKKSPGETSNQQAHWNQLKTEIPRGCFKGLLRKPKVSTTCTTQNRQWHYSSTWGTGVNWMSNVTQLTPHVQDKFSNIDEINIDDIYKVH